MATKSLKCPARIIMYKDNPPRFVSKNQDHKHAELKRSKYSVFGKRSEILSEYISDDSYIKKDSFFEECSD